jgi:hypothetical protein
MPNLIREDEARDKLFKQHGDKIIVDDYLKMGDMANFTCTICGHKWTSRATEVITVGKGCEPCVKKKNGLKCRISMDIAKKRIFDIHGDNILLLEYERMTDSNSLFKCIICGHEWRTSAKSVAYGVGCVECFRKRNSGSQRHSIEYIDSYLKKYNCKLIDTEYIGNQIPILVEFECGHQLKISFACFIMGQRCKICSKKNRIENSKLSFGTINEDLKNHNFEFIDFPFGYQKNNSYIRYMCKNGHITQRSVMMFRKRPFCKECKRQERKVALLGNGHHNWKGTRNLRLFLMRSISNWKKESMIACNYKCVVTGENFDQIHHLYNFNKIIDESLNELVLVRKVKNGDYSQDDLLKIISKVQEIHTRYPLGVCLRKDVHKLFHSMFGRINNTPSQFYEFQQKIASGEITI